jgi:adenylylsulfate reductase subunit A
MVTKEAFQDPHKETVGWEKSPGMTIGQAGLGITEYRSQGSQPLLTTSEPYVMGCTRRSGAWASGPETTHLRIPVGYNRMMTVEGPFGAGDTLGGTAHKFSSGSFTEGRIAGKQRLST